MKIGKKIIRFKSLLAISILVQIIHNAAKVMMPYSLMLIINCITLGDNSGFYGAIKLAILVEFIKILFDFINIYFTNCFVKKNITWLKGCLLDTIFTYPYYWFKNREISEYKSLFLNDLNTVESSFYKSILSITNCLSLLLISVIMVGYIQPAFLLGYPIALMVSFLIPAIYSKRLPKFNREVMYANQNLTKILDEQFEGFDTIKSYNLFDRVKASRDKCINFLELKKFIFTLNIHFSNSILGIIIAVLWILIYYVGGKSVLSTSMTVGGFVALIRLVPDVLNPCIQLPQHINSLNSSKPVLDKCKSILDFKSEEELIQKESLVKEIKLEKMSFTYPNNNEPTLEEISYTFEKGKRYAIVGENGCGKSTLLKILAGYYNNYEGNVLFDSVDRKLISEKSIFYMVTYISQKVFLFHTSILDNILLGKDINRSYLDNIVQSLKLTTLMERFEEKNESVDELSGGERQKISIARSLVNNKDILLADEPTSALDKMATSKVESMILSQNDKLTIVITHNIGENLKEFDEILVLNKGRIQESGSYLELQKSGSYLISVLSKLDNTN